jgi:hypothetical protein
MKASEIIERGRSLADLQTSQAIDHDFEINSINEAWRDVFHIMTIKCNDDYFSTRVTITITNAMKVGDWEWEVPLPSDCSQIRAVDYQTNGLWRPMDRFAPRARNGQSSIPSYRIKNGLLWVIGSTSYGLADVRVTYYPPPVKITLPEPEITYCAALVQAGKAVAVGRPYYAAPGQTLIYHSATAISAESYTANTITALTTGTAVKQPIYYKGYLYWLDTTIRRGATELVAAIAAPVNLAIAANGFTIYNDLIYYFNGTQIRTCTLAGGSDTLVYTLAATSLEVVAGNIVCSLAGGSVYVNGTLVTGTAGKLATDGTYLYSLQPDKTLVRMSVSSTAVTVLGIIASDVGDIGKSQTRLGVVFYTSQDVQAIDLEVDYDFTYPLNLVPEYMAYRCGVDFMAKFQADTSQLRDTMAIKVKELTSSLTKQDIGQPERTSNFYTGVGWGAY